MRRPLADYSTRNDELCKDPLQEYNTLTPVDRARDHYSITETELVSREKEAKEGVRTLVRKEVNHFLCNGRCAICFDNDASEAEVIADTKKSRKVNHQIHWRPEQNAKYWIYLSATQKPILEDRVWAVITYQSLPEECVVKVVNEDGNENCSQKTTQASKGPKVTLRNTRVHRTPTFQACLVKPRVIWRLGTWPNSIRESQLAGREFTRTSSTYKELKNRQAWCSAVTDALFHCQRVHQKDQQEDIQICRFLIPSQ